MTMDKGFIIITTLVIVVLLQCSGHVDNTIPSFSRDPYRSNGERIYHTGISERTGRIEIQGGPPWLRTHGGGCIACHGPDGQGGITFADSAVSADIRYSSLTSEKHRNGMNQHGHKPYDNTLIMRAITKGIDPAGKALHWIMPRWKMSEEDLNDIIEYLKFLK
jgi:mono/diheme cytochrome c family protein